MLSNPVCATSPSATGVIQPELALGEEECLLCVYEPKARNKALGKQAFHGGKIRFCILILYSGRFENRGYRLIVHKRLIYLGFNGPLQILQRQLGLPSF